MKMRDQFTLLITIRMVKINNHNVHNNKFVFKLNIVSLRILL